MALVLYEPRQAMTDQWTFETLLAHLTALIDANDRRYEQRFKDSQTAVDAALNAARTAVDAALTSAKEAVQKAEVASEKRFEGVNEFRQTLGDQQRAEAERTSEVMRTLMPRPEAELRLNAMESRLAILEKANTEREGQKTGSKETSGNIKGAIAFGITLMLAALALLGFIATRSGR